MADLDNLKTIEKYDRSDMLKLIKAFPEQCVAARNIGDLFHLPRVLKRNFKNIVITGLGGSAIGADILRSYIADESDVPVFVNRNYALPNFVGPGTLVVAASYSGNTEETISAYTDGRMKKAECLVITSGGKLQLMAESDKVPLIKIPDGLPPRASLGFSFFPLLIVLSRLGLIEDISARIEGVIKLLRGMNETLVGQDVATGKNISKKIACAVFQKCPVIYGSQDHIDAVVTRWRGQFEENAKTLAFTHILPEMNHNEIVGWQNPARVLKNFIVIILRDAGDHPRISKRIDITKRIIEDQGVSVMEVRSLGRDLLSRIFSLVYIGDYASYYLAILNGTDPTPVDRISYLKRMLAKS